MTLETLLLDLESKNIWLRRDGEELVILGSPEALDSELISRLRTHKGSLLHRLAEGGQTGSSAPVEITPEMLTMVDLTPAEIDSIVDRVPGGARNVQDIYPLAPLQEGLLFHHLMAPEGDPYLLSLMLAFDSRARLDDYLNSLQSVIDRHDILRTAVLWEGLSEPVQVVLRKARLVVEEIVLDASEGEGAEQLYARFNPRHYRIDVRQAPLMRVFVAQDAARGRWLLLMLLQHLAGDHTTVEVMQEEVRAHLLGRADRLPPPQPFRNLVAQARLGRDEEEQEAFFRRMLADVDEPTAPFGLVDVFGNGSGTTQAELPLDADLAKRLRERARRLGLSVASLFHLAWAMVLSRVSGREDVVFGTVLVGRMQGGDGADRAMGPFINTLPLRIRVGNEPAEASVRAAHELLAELLLHEQASLALAQRCSSVLPPAPLFSALLNYRHDAETEPGSESADWEGIETLFAVERTNYPLTLSVDDLGEGFRLTAKVHESIDPMRICRFMHVALDRLVGALETAPSRPIRSVDVMPEAEARQLVEGWNATEAAFPEECIHELFEAQAEKAPHAVAVVHQGVGPS